MELNLNNSIMETNKFSCKKSGGVYSLASILAFIVPMIINFALVAILGLIEADGSFNMPEWLIWLNVATTQMVFLFISFVIIKKSNMRTFKQCFAEFGINKKPNVVAIVVLSIVVIAMASFISPLMQMFIDAITKIGYTPMENAIPTLDNGISLTLAIICLAILPAICEEVLFRGVILKGSAKCGKWFAIVFSAFLFMLMHQNIEQTLYQFALGVLLAFVAVETKSLIIPVVLHFVNNLYAVIITYLETTNVVPSSTTNVLSIAMMVVCGVITVLVFAYILLKEKFGINLFGAKKSDKENDTCAKVAGDNIDCQKNKLEECSVLESKVLNRDSNQAQNANKYMARKKSRNELIRFAIFGIMFNALIFVLALFGLL